MSLVFVHYVLFFSTRCCSRFRSLFSSHIPFPSFHVQCNNVSSRALTRQRISIRYLFILEVWKVRYTVLLNIPGAMMLLYSPHSTVPSAYFFVCMSFIFISSLTWFISFMTGQRIAWRYILLQNFIFFPLIKSDIQEKERHRQR